MGGAQGTFSGYEIEELEACSFFTRSEIFHIYNVYATHAAKFNKSADDRLHLSEVSWSCIVLNACMVGGLGLDVRRY